MQFSRVAIEQSQLLFTQRLSLISDRYAAAAAIKMHDRRLLDAVQQIETAPQQAEPPYWLKWLLASDEQAALPDITRLEGFNVPAQAWQLLLDIKYRLHGAKVLQLVESVLPQTHQADSAYAQLWHFAARQQLPLLQIAVRTLKQGPATPEAILYLGFSGDRSMLSLLQNLSGALRADDTCYAASQFSAYLLGQQVDEVELVTLLAQTSQITDVALMLLLANAPYATQMQLINTLSADFAQTTLAIRAMAYSCQVKFVPLLIELARQQATEAVALNALTLLIGATDVDTLLSADSTSALLKGQNKLAGADISNEKLAIIWRQGNVAQRQLVACRRFFSAPGNALIFADCLMDEASYDY